jgi:hypothetical protein
VSQKTHEVLYCVREGYVKKDWEEQIDTSVGLAFSLRAFETYRTSGTFSAEVRAVPGIRGQCQAYLELIEGKIMSCYLIDRTGQRHNFAKESLIKLDEAKGPFSWTFRKTTPLTSTTPFPEQTGKLAVPQLPRFPVPIRLIHHLDLQLLQPWTPEQQRCLYMVFSMVNGRRGIDEIKERSSLPPEVVEQAIQVLVRLQAIAMH